jgi:hypothetical protein
VPERSHPRPAAPRAVDPTLPADLDAVAGNLHTEFDARLGATVVNAEIHRAAEPFTDAPIRAFVPLFVRRYARKDLAGKATTQAAGRTPPVH